ncbi:protein asteroid homolog 1-like [Dysidea avara]|uniref:protein asteroid homolog 1-like n=1 Tax=Dysidea avara TaxID=196820 RepID=UPI0033322405
MVRGLTSLIIEKYKWKKVSLSGDLIVDVYSLCHLLHSTKVAISSRCGGDYVTFSRYVERFLRCLTLNKINPYFVFDGVDADQRKKETNNLRRNAAAEVAFSLLKGKSTNISKDHLPYLAKLAMIETVRRVLGENNFCVVDGDADGYVANFAITRNCPVLSLDSDYCIFHIPSGYIPYNKLSWSEDVVEAYIYYYTDFAEQFHLQDPSLLIMLPAILGDSKLQTLSDVITRATGKSWMKLSEAAPHVMDYIATFSTLDECKRSISQYDPLIRDNVHSAYQTYIKPPEENRLKYKRRSYVPVPKFIVDRFRKGKLTQMLMEAICFSEVDHRIAIEDIQRPWCHMIGLPIRQIMYGIVSGMYGVTEHHRLKGKIHDFENALVETNIPVQFWCISATAAILDPQYQTILKGCNEDILLDAIECSKEFKKTVPQEFWFLYHVSRFWYLHAKFDVELKNVLLKAIILCVMKNTVATKWHTSGLPDLPFIFNFSLQSLVHALSQWQSVYHDLLCLNQILLEPLAPMQISQTINCTTIIKFHEFITKDAHGDKALISKMELDEKVYDILYNLITG